MPLKTVLRHASPMQRREAGAHPYRIILCELPENGVERWATWVEVHPPGKKPYRHDGHYHKTWSYAEGDFASRCRFYEIELRAWRYPACYPCTRGMHLDGAHWETHSNGTFAGAAGRCACCASHVAVTCPSCEAPVMERDTGGGPYHPMLICGSCRQTVLEPCGDPDCGDCNDNTEAYGQWETFQEAQQGEGP